MASSDSRQAGNADDSGSCGPSAEQHDVVLRYPSSRSLSGDS